MQTMLLDAVLLNDRQVRPVRTYDGYAQKETDAAIAARLAVLEAKDPSQRRPTPKPQTNVDWMEYDA